MENSYIYETLLKDDFKIYGEGKTKKDALKDLINQYCIYKNFIQPNTLENNKDLKVEI